MMLNGMLDKITRTAVLLLNYQSFINFNVIVPFVGQVIGFLQFFAIV
jgi:hypothetical protein